MSTLFTIPVPSLPPTHPGGTIEATSPTPGTYLLTISSPPDNRLTSPLCQALLTALQTLEATHPTGVLLLTSALPKHFSNGLDIPHAKATEPAFWTHNLYPLFRRLLAYPMPVLAVLNGHAFAAGLMLAMMCDYRVMNPQRGFLCLNEIDFGALLKAPMSSIFREKVGPQAYRALVLEGRRFGGREALEAGIVDALGGVEEALGLVAKKGLGEKGRSGVYGMMKVEMYRETMEYLSEEGYEREEAKERALVESDEKRRKELLKTAKL